MRSILTTALVAFSVLGPVGIAAAQTPPAPPPTTVQTHSAAPSQYLFSGRTFNFNIDPGMTIKAPDVHDNMAIKPGLNIDPGMVVSPHVILHDTFPQVKPFNPDPGMTLKAPNVGDHITRANPNAGFVDPGIILTPQTTTGGHFSF